MPKQNARKNVQKRRRRRRKWEKRFKKEACARCRTRIALWTLGESDNDESRYCHDCGVFLSWRIRERCPDVVTLPLVHWVHTFSIHIDDPSFPGVIPSLDKDVMDIEGLGDNWTFRVWNAGFKEEWNGSKATVEYGPGLWMDIEAEVSEREDEPGCRVTLFRMVDGEPDILAMRVPRDIIMDDWTFTVLHCTAEGAEHLIGACIRSWENGCLSAMLRAAQSA